MTQRLYRGFCISPDAVAEALGAIRSQQDEILGVIAEIPGLSEKESKDAVKYLDKFFDQADNEEKLLKSFERRCIKS